MHLCGMLALPEMLCREAMLPILFVGLGLAVSGLGLTEFSVRGGVIPNLRNENHM